LEPPRRDPARRVLSGLAAAAAVALVAACGQGAPADGAAAPAEDARIESRASRYGIFEDLVFFERTTRDGGPFWLDRFESTRLDWAVYERTLGLVDAAAAVEDPRLPRVGIDWFRARAYAAWRFGRLPRFDEWKWAANGGGLDRYAWPWGDQRNVAWANTGDLALGFLTPAGSFESGRQVGGPYDLVGNAGEWTLTPARRPDATPQWLVDGFARRLRHARNLGLSVWRPAGTPCPGSVLLAFEPERTRRIVCGHFARAMEEATQVWSRAPRTFGSTTGVRVATDPETLLQRMLADGEPAEASDRRIVRRFVLVPRHLEVLRAAWARLVAAGRASGPGEAFLRTLLEVPEPPR
jgi:hypothetical protein